MLYKEYSPPCWKCGLLVPLSQGKISKSGRVFTCFSCLTSWHREEALKRQEEYNKKPISQMDIFEIEEMYCNIF